MVEVAPVRALVAQGSVVVCAGGGGVPVVREADGRLRGVEAVVDKDLTAALLGTELGADLLVLLTDVAAVELGHGTSAARPIGHTTVSALRRQDFAAGSMGPKVDAACRFVEATAKTAVIGRMEDAVALVAGAAGTVVPLPMTGGVRTRALRTLPTGFPRRPPRARDAWASRCSPAVANQRTKDGWWIRGLVGSSGPPNPGPTPRP